MHGKLVGERKELLAEPCNKVDPKKSARLVGGISAYPLSHLAIDY